MSTPTYPNQPASIPPEYAPPPPPAPYLPGYSWTPLTVPSRAYASLGNRFLAYVIDLLIVSVASGLIIAIPTVMTVTAAASGSNAWTITSGLLTAVASIVVIGLVIWYFPYQWSRSGQTYGQRLMRVRVVRKRDGQFLSFGAALLRFIVGMGIVDNIVFGLPIGYLWALWDPEKQAWHDKISDSIVVDAS